jgi:prolyl 4-hydroxylase
MDQYELAYELIKGAVSGVSKTQVINHMKKNYNQTNEQIKQLLHLCNFKSKPKKINYEEFAARSFTSKAKRFHFPFTQIYTVDEFLTPAECSDLIEISGKILRPSTVADVGDTRAVTKVRTSKTADLHYFNSLFLNHIDNKIADFMGLYPFLGETLQAQKYNPGQYYKEHTDYFCPLAKEFKTYTEWMGQRTWTTMVYLNDVEEGGETYFKHLKLKIKPTAGKAVIWNNLYASGIPNPKTLHEALPPISGDKYVITKWWRSWPLI